MRSLVVVMLAPLMLPAIAATSTGHCDSYGGPALGEIEISPTNEGNSTFYVDDRGYLLGDGLWVYEESNGVFVGGDASQDLQRGGVGILDPYLPGGDREICTDVGPWQPDTLIY